MSFRWAEYSIDLLSPCQVVVPYILLNMLNLALVGEQESRVRDLAGFQKSHRIPEEDSQRSRAFVCRIAAADIDRDLDQRFADIRRELGLKRVQLEVLEPKSGCARIAGQAL